MSIWRMGIVLDDSTPIMSSLEANWGLEQWSITVHLIEVASLNEDSES